MEQIDKLKALICQLIDTNQFLLSLLNSIKQRGDMLPIIELSYTKSSIYNPTTNTVNISISDIIDFYRLAKLYNSEERPTNIINSLYLSKHFHCETFGEISVKMPMVESECDIIERIIKGTNFLKGKEMTMSIFDTLTTYSIAYSLCHELGHAFHNKYILEPIKREMAADAFAFEAVKSMCDNNEIDFLLIGAIIGVIQVLVRSNPQNERDDKEHPHSIERLYKLFSLWEIQDNSQYWELAFLFVSRWCRWNHEPMVWLKGSSKLPIEKFMDAYYHYRKLQI
jgi:hypothetical protein